MAFATSSEFPAIARSKIALWAGCLSTGGFLSPLLGGITGNYGSWRWAFVVVTILAAASALVSQLLARDSSAPEGRSLDPAGQLTVGIGLFGCSTR